MKKSLNETRVFRIVGYGSELWSDQCRIWKYDKMIDIVKRKLLKLFDHIIQLDRLQKIMIQALTQKKGETVEVNGH